MENRKTEMVFKKAISCFITDENIIADLWRDIEKQYAHSSRHYHTLAHLDHLTHTLWQVKSKIQNWNIMVLAIAYHDIVYNTLKSDNEEKSAAWADKIMSEILPAEEREWLSQFIIATKAHGRNANDDINYFTDADLSVLGASADEYVLYTKQIRKEYKRYPLFIYKPGRAKVLRHFLGMDAIFKTGFFYERFEKTARLNLERELQTMAG